jgi:hypothetical protein
MPYVVVDTNALMRDYLLIEANMQTFLQGCQRCDIAVFVPEIVVDELCGNYEREIGRLKSMLHSATRKLTTALGVKVDVTDFDVKEEARSYRKHVYEMFGIHDVAVATYPNLSPKTLVDASYSGKKPFKETGEGFKDFIVFETLKAVATQQDSDGTFVTANKRDFCCSDGKLHPDLQSALQQQVTIYDNIHDFNIAIQSRPQESEQGDKWSFCLTAGTLCQRIRRDDEQTTAPEPYTGLQGESGSGRHQRRSNACPTGGAFRCPPQSDYDMESATRR